MTEISTLTDMTDELSDSDDLVIRDSSSGTDKRAGYDILVRDPLRESVEAATGGRMTVLYDDHDLPNYMHIIPRFRYEDLGFSTELGTGDCTAFVVGGVAKPEIFIGAYQASAKKSNTVAVSLPKQDPWVGIDWDDAKAACDTKGTGWHMMTVHEWAAVALWCKANGFEPRGNTDDGRAHDATHETGVRPDGIAPGDTAGDARTYTGSGPAAWRHDGEYAGIADLVGNVWEWLWGMKLVDGRIHAAADNDWTLIEGSWTDTAVDASGGSFNSRPAGSQLTDRLLLTHNGIDLQGDVYTNASGERFPLRGGNWGRGGDAGLAALNLNGARSYTNGTVGFRPAFVA